MSIYDISVKDIHGEEFLLDKYKGEVMLIVNTASDWGLKTQFGELEEIYQKYKHKGFVVLAFPCNQFNNQEPLSEDEIKKVYPEKFNVHYPIFSKISVNGADEHPLYTYLKKEKGGLLVSKIKWNFTKFLVDREGNVVERYSPQTSPKDVEEYIVDLL